LCEDLIKSANLKIITDFL